MERLREKLAKGAKALVALQEVAGIAEVLFSQEMPLSAIRIYL